MPGGEPLGWGPVVVLLLIAIAFGVGVVFASKVVDWFMRSDRTGARKDTAYETGMPPIGDTRKRFNVRFYLVAMLFLLFDVEVVFLYPWAKLLAGSINDYKLDPTGATSEVLARLPDAMHMPDVVSAWTFLVVTGILFMSVLVVGFLYELRQGVLDFE